MDVDFFSKCLKELILGNDIVNVPGLGCFIADLMPASFSDKGTTINPPYRKLSFRSYSAEDGNVFLNKVKENGIEDAERDLSDFITLLKKELNQKKSVIIPHLGIMRATSENDYFFVADENLDIYEEGLGLEPVSIKVSNKEPAPVEVTPLPPEPSISEVEVAELPDSEEIQEVEKKCKKHSAWRIILIVLASILVAVILFLVIIYVFKESLSPFSYRVTEWIDSLLDHILYSEEELNLLGRQL